MKRPLVVIGLLGPVLDNGKGAERWERWRPTVALCQHEDLLISRFEILHQKKFQALSDVVCGDVASMVPGIRVNCHNLEYDDAWDFELVYAALHDWAREYAFKPEEEDYLVHITTGSHVAQICLFLLTESRVIPGRLVQSEPPRKGSGAAGAYSIIDLDLSKYDRLAARFQASVKESTSFLKSGIETRNKKFNRLIEQLEQVAVGSKAPILLTGPTGSGKSQLARRVFELKQHRRQLGKDVGKFVEVNCATLRGDGAMSALFGHVRGAFTGAMSDRPGLLRAADGGLLFLDEIGELGVDEQAMLLRALEDKRFLPVGADKEVRSEFQLIAGTNRDLRAEVVAGRFREDLLARIHLWTFKLPALAERREDIEPNLGYELEQYEAASGVKVRFNKEAREVFLRFALSPEASWRGNFRDLSAAVTRMATFAAGGRITVEIAQEEIERLKGAWSLKGSAPSELSELLGEKVAEVDAFDLPQLEEVVRVCRSSRSLSEAGRRLFAVSRAKKGSVNDSDRLRKYLARFGLDWGQVSATVD